MFTKESTFIRHEPCPECGSRDNLSVWSDGHKYCFGCGHYVAADGKSLDIMVLKNRLTSTAASKPLQRLPDDCNYSFPKEAIDWLEEAQIGPSMAVKHGLRWSQEEEGLIIPVYDDDHQLVMYQIRRFDYKPKYENRGNLGNHVPILGDNKSNGIVVLVEDYLSAIRVSDFADACPLFGSHVSKTLMTRLSKVYDRVLFWLDNDKAKESIKFYSTYRYLFKEAKVIVSQKDPKELDDGTLMEEIFGSFDYDESPLQEDFTMVQY